MKRNQLDLIMKKEKLITLVFWRLVEWNALIAENI